MQRAKTFFIPAGMSVSVSGDLRLKKPKSTRRAKTVEDVDLWSEISAQMSTKHNTSKRKETRQPPKTTRAEAPKALTPPKVICKKQTVDINLEDFGVKINDNVQFDGVPSNSSVASKPYKIPHRKHPRFESKSNTQNSNTQCHQRDKYINKNQYSQSSSLVAEENWDVCQDKKQNQDKKPRLTRLDLYKKIVALKAQKEKQQKNVFENLEPLIIEPDAQKCNCESCDEFINCTDWCNNNVSFREVPRSDKKALPLLAVDTALKTFNIIKSCHNQTLLHGVFIPKPVTYIDKTNFPETIKRNLKTSITSLQSCVWTPAQRGFHIFMIGGAESDKTMSYLPAFCSFALEKTGRYQELSQYAGPLALILCPNKQKCEEIHTLVVNLLSSSEIVTVGVLTGSTVIKANYDVLITTPLALEQNLKSQSVKLKRLCHLALEDAQVLFKNDAKSLEKVFKILQKVQTNRPHNKNIQVVVCSKKWTADVGTLTKKLFTAPLICFEDFYAAALYAKIEFQRKKLKLLHKIFYLVDTFKAHYSTHKIVVFCNDMEIGRVSDHCRMNGVECISISNDLVEDERAENELMWDSLSNGRYRVLLCCDSTYEKTKITSANWIVHYSPPADWTSFQKRFRCISDDLRSPYDDVPEVGLGQDKRCFLLIDESSKSDFYADFFEDLTKSFINNFCLD